MANLTCLIKDTQIVEDIKDILRTAATLEIDEGRTFSLPKAYSMLRQADVEVDLESVGALYEDVFDLSDGNFTSKADLDEIVGASFKDTLDNLVAMQPRHTDETTGVLAPAARVAKTLAGVFRSANVTDTHTYSLMLQMQKALEKGARRIIKNANPATPAAPADFEAILTQALDLENRGFTTLQGGINNMGDVWKEFQAEISKYQQELRNKGASRATIDAYDVMADAITNKGYELFLSTREAQDVVKGALIEAGFGRTTTRNGQPTQALDWRKLADIGGDVNVMAQNVAKVLQDRGFSQAHIDRVNQSLQAEYVKLKQSIIEKGQAALDRRNEVGASTQKSAAKRLAELYTYGLFNAAPSQYEHLLNNLFGMSDVDQATYDKLKVFAGSLQTLYSTRFNDQQLNEAQLKTAVNKIGEQIQEVLHSQQNSHSGVLRVMRIFQTFMEAGQRMILNSLKNVLLQNQISGITAKVTGKIGYNRETTKELRAQIGATASATRKDIVRNAGTYYGDLNTLFVNRGSFDNFMNKFSDKQGYHKFMSVLIGRLGLDAMDSYYKVSLVEKKFIAAVVKILTDPTNQASKVNGKTLTKDQALSLVSGVLTGQNFENAKITARNAVRKINQQAGRVVLSEDENHITRMANDMVKAALVQQAKVTETQLTAAYNSAYKAAGRDLGHVPNNLISTVLKNTNAWIDTGISNQLKTKNYGAAAALTFTQVFVRNIANPFVGGATNWIVLKLEKMGMGIISAPIYSVFKGKPVDLSSEIDSGRLENRLYADFREKDIWLRTGIGVAVSTLLHLAAANLLEDCESPEDADCYGAWRQRHKALSRYLDEFTPETYLAALAWKDDRFVEYVTNLFGRNKDFSSENQLWEAAKKWKSDRNEAQGLVGKAVGQHANFPIPWRPAREVWTIAQEIQFIRDENAGRIPVVVKRDGKDFLDKNGNVIPSPVFKNDYTPSRGFWDGVMRGGLVEMIGINPKGDYELSDLPGVGAKTREKLNDLGIKSIDDLRGRRVRGLKHEGRRIFKKEDAEEIESILKKQQRD